MNQGTCHTARRRRGDGSSSRETSCRVRPCRSGRRMRDSRPLGRCDRELSSWTCRGGCRRFSYMRIATWCGRPTSVKAAPEEPRCWRSRTRPSKRLDQVIDFAGGHSVRWSPRPARHAGDAPNVMTMPRPKGTAGLAGMSGGIPGSATSGVRELSVTEEFSPAVGVLLQDDAIVSSVAAPTSRTVR